MCIYLDNYFSAEPRPRICQRKSGNFILITNHLAVLMHVVCEHAWQLGVQFDTPSTLSA